MLKTSPFWSKCYASLPNARNLCVKMRLSRTMHWERRAKKKIQRNLLAAWLNGRRNYWVRREGQKKRYIISGYLRQ